QPGRSGPRSPSRRSGTRAGHRFPSDSQRSLPARRGRLQVRRHRAGRAPLRQAGQVLSRLPASEASPVRDRFALDGESQVMKRLLFAALILLPVALYAQAPDRDMLLTSAGTLYTIESLPAADGAGTFLTLTINDGRS